MRIKQHMAENIQNYHVECAKLIHINTWEKCRGISSDGRALAKQIEADLLTRVEALKAKSGRTPILATILVGDDGASATYVRMKAMLAAVLVWIH